MFGRGGYEVYRISNRFGDLTMAGYQNGKGPYRFDVPRAAGDVAVFARSGDSAPYRITYRRRANGLSVAAGPPRWPPARRSRMRAAPDAPAPDVEAADRAFSADVVAAAESEGPQAAAARWRSWFDVGDQLGSPEGGRPLSAEAGQGIARIVSRGDTFSWTPHYSGCSPDGAWAFTAGLWESWQSDMGTVEGYVTVWFHEPDGQWRPVFRVRT